MLVDVADLLSINKKRQRERNACGLSVTQTIAVQTVRIPEALPPLSGTERQIPNLCGVSVAPVAMQKSTFTSVMSQLTSLSVPSRLSEAAGGPQVQVRGSDNCNVLLWCFWSHRAIVLCCCCCDLRVRITPVSI